MPLTKLMFSPMDTAGLGFRKSRIISWAYTLVAKISHIIGLMIQTLQCECGPGVLVHMTSSV